MTDRELLRKVGTGAASLIRPGMTIEEIATIGASFAATAEVIFRAVGGREYAAKQFYAAADRLAAPEDEG
jgi:methionine aminopeptidase